MHITRCHAEEVDDHAYAPLPKISNRNLQPSANNFITQTLTFRPKNSSPLPSLGLTLGQVHQSTNALRAADYPPHPLWLWHALCNHVDYRFHFSTPLPFSLFIIFCPFASRCYFFDSVSFFFFLVANYCLRPVFDIYKLPTR